MMEMTTTYKCNRCRRSLDDEKAFALTVDEIFYGETDLDHWNDPKLQRHLCRACLDQLDDWIEGERDRPLYSMGI